MSQPAIHAIAKALAADRGLDLDNLEAHADPGDTQRMIHDWRENWLNDGRIALDAITEHGWVQPGTYAHLAKAIRDLLDAISDMAIRNSDVDGAAMVLRGELVDAGWDEQP